MKKYPVLIFVLIMFLSFANAQNCKVDFVDEIPSELTTCEVEFMINAINIERNERLIDVKYYSENEIKEDLEVVEIRNTDTGKIDKILRPKNWLQSIDQYGVRLFVGNKNCDGIKVYVFLKRNGQWILKSKGAIGSGYYCKKSKVTGTQ